MLRALCHRAYALLPAAVIIASLCHLCDQAPLLHTGFTLDDYALLSDAVRRSLLTPEVEARMRNARRVLLLCAADPTSTIYLPLVRRVYNRSFPRMYQLLSSSSDVQRLQRLSTHRFAFDRLQKHLSPREIYAKAFNREPLLAGAGQRIFAGGALVTVERSRTIHGRPMRTNEHLDLSLDDPGVVLLQQTAGGLLRVSFPPVGASMLVNPPVPSYALIANSTGLDS